jgi:hypothetical protein
LLSVSCFREKFVALQLSTFATQSLPKADIDLSLTNVGFGPMLSKKALI